jgi:glycosyltransferase involved in cell wall biosynthesis
MTPDMPSVSVVVPCHNCAAYVGDTIASVLAQDFAGFELLTVDDGSTDTTLAVLRPFERDRRVRVITLPTSHGGPAKARNTGIAASRGTLVMVLDSDDLLRPGALGAACGTPVLQLPARRVREQTRSGARPDGVRKLLASGTNADRRRSVTRR